ncbi:DNA recombination protein RmuC [Candidatus Neomarinimicrobiota bacterium]
MEYIAAFLLLVFILLLVILLTRRSQGSDKIEALLSRNFLEFQQHVQRTMDSTRQEVEKSKDVLSDTTIKTLETIKNMGKTVESLVQQQAEATELGQSLKYLLQSPKLRGSYGEAVLEEMLDRVLPKGVWERQYTIEGQEKVDAVVKVKNVVVPIDAKFPREIYERYLNSQEEVPEQKKRHWKAYEDALKQQIRSIESKYIKPEQGTTEFALMFIPSEAIYYETIAEKNFLGEPSAIFEYAQKNKVIPVSPNTFYAFLQMVIIGIRNVEILEDARVLQQGLATLQRNFDLFYKKFETIGKNLDNASEAYRVGEGHIRKFKDNLAATIELELPSSQVPEIDSNSSTDQPI